MGIWQRPGRGTRFLACLSLSCGFWSCWRGRPQDFRIPLFSVIGGTLSLHSWAIQESQLNLTSCSNVILATLYGAAWKRPGANFPTTCRQHSALAFGWFLQRHRSGAWRAGYLGFDWKIGLVLGAVSRATDALAADIHERIGLPKRITDISEERDSTMPRGCWPSSLASASS